MIDFPLSIVIVVMQIVAAVFFCAYEISYDPKDVLCYDSTTKYL